MLRSQSEFNKSLYTKKTVLSEEDGQFEFKTQIKLYITIKYNNIFKL